MSKLEVSAKSEAIDIMPQDLAITPKGNLQLQELPKLQKFNVEGAVGEKVVSLVGSPPGVHFWRYNSYNSFKNPPLSTPPQEVILRSEDEPDIHHASSSVDILGSSPGSGDSSLSDSEESELFNFE
jgi:hypothetical protein